MQVLTEEEPGCGVRLGKARACNGTDKSTAGHGDMEPGAKAGQWARSCDPAPDSPVTRSQQLVTT